MIENTFTEDERVQENKQIHNKLGKTWFFDLDGTLLKSTSNEKLDQLMSKYGKSSHRQEEVLTSSKQFLKNIPKSDQVVLTTARAKRHKDHTIKVLEYVGIKYNQIIMSKQKILFFKNIVSFFNMISIINKILNNITNVFITPEPTNNDNGKINKINKFIF